MIDIEYSAEEWASTTGTVTPTRALSWNTPEKVRRFGRCQECGAPRDEMWYTFLDDDMEDVEVTVLTCVASFYLEPYGPIRARTWGHHARGRVGDRAVRLSEQPTLL